ncbi:hypothetical protein P3X46_028956 [Hevea brasiliensis]|uniref:GST C-terminal domain-containing protein n=1 Tax=Hevea brasiliensis TaxID=3981 RepID=A0ABQ9KRL5_HEVBR|nr:hypothetical protein P3X46_028956 [Hevea brasiliensis]
MQILRTAIKIGSAKEEEKEEIIEEVSQLLKLLESELKEREFFGGETIGFLDIVAFMTALWFQVPQEVMQIQFISEEKLTVLCKWMEKLRKIQVVNDCLPPRDKLIAFVKARIEAANFASK